MRTVVLEIDDLFRTSDGKFNVKIGQSFNNYTLRVDYSYPSGGLLSDSWGNRLPALRARRLRFWPLIIL